MDSRTNPMAPNLVGDNSVDGEIAGEQEPLKMTEGGTLPPPGALDYAFPATSPTEDPRRDPGVSRDPGLLPGSRDPGITDSAEDVDRPGHEGGNTPDAAEGAMGSEGE